MAIKIAKPKKRILSNPPSREEPKITNLKKKGSKDLVTLNFKVQAEFRRDLKMYAAKKDMSMVDVLKAAYDFYKQKNI